MVASGMKGPLYQWWSKKKSSSLDHTYCVEQKLKSFQLHVLDMADTLKVKAW